MKKDTKLNLNQIEIQSFVTQLSKPEKQTVEGAGSWITFVVRCCETSNAPTMEGNSCVVDQCRTFPDTPCPLPQGSTHIQCPDSGAAGCAITLDLKVL